MDSVVIAPLPRRVSVSGSPRTPAAFA